MDSQAVYSALAKVVTELRAAANEQGVWTGRLASSALSTATAVSALALVAEHSHGERLALRDLVAHGVRWLAQQPNRDGGFGDTDRSHSNIATTMLVRAAFQLAGAARDHGDLLDLAERYVADQGGISGLRQRYGKDKTFAVPILTNCALAGLVDWREVSALPFELACVPQSWYRFLRLPVVSYAIPALVAIGQARFAHRPPWNPLTRMIRAASQSRSLAVLERMQPRSGGFLEATPLTSFVVMSLASIGLADHPVVTRGVQFLVDSMRPDGSWPIDTNLATWNTTLAMNALAATDPRLAVASDIGYRAYSPQRLQWLLHCQHRVVHPYTGAAPGGWAWTDLSGGVPDVDDTSGALLALAACRPNATPDEQSAIDYATAAGVQWLLDVQNRDGGWPTFCRGWGTLPFDRSGTDLTAHAIRALRTQLGDSRCRAAIDRGLRFLERAQRADGSWVPLWFGNQDHPHEENPIYGTARVLLAYRDLNHLEAAPARLGITYLCRVQNPDGGWGGAGLASSPPPSDAVSTVEETALATEALLAADGNEIAQAKAQQGVAWLVAAVQDNRHIQPAAIGFYFARLWYYERLYPLTFTASALGQAASRLRPRPEPTPTPPRGRGG